jgi:hypothetical protein
LINIKYDNLTFYILNGLGSDFREIATPLLTFDELHDILEGHDSYLRRLESSTQQLVASANYSYHHKQNFISYGGSHPKGSNKTNGSSLSPGHNKIPQGRSIQRQLQVFNQSIHSNTDLIK